MTFFCAPHHHTTISQINQYSFNYINQPTLYYKYCVNRQRWCGAAAPYAKCFYPSLIPLVVYMAHICLCAHIKFRKKKNIFFSSVNSIKMHRVYFIRKKKKSLYYKAHYIDRQKKSLQKLFLRSRHVLCEFI